MKSLSFILIGLFITILTQAQGKEFPKGKVFGTVYFDVYTEINKGESESAMEIRRAYFGYKYSYNENFQAYLKLDIGSPNDLSSSSLIRRYAYFKNAGLKYHKDNFTLNIGITDVLMYTVQEKYWGHRYINKSFMDRFKFGPKADIGLNANYKLNDFISLDFGFYNGEGYKNLQNDNSYRGGLGISIFPIKNLIIRTYGDYTQKTFSRYTGAIFMGYKYKNKGVFGAEYNYQANYKFHSNENLFGYSVFGSWNLNNKWQYFARFDQINSNILENEDNPWNLDHDGSAITTGFQYLIHKGIKASINYQDWVYYTSNLDGHKFLFINLEVKF